jgi:hypothetical protein
MVELNEAIDGSDKPEPKRHVWVWSDAPLEFLPLKMIPSSTEKSKVSSSKTKVQSEEDGK